MKRIKNIIVNSSRIKLAVVAMLVIFSEELGFPIPEESIEKIVAVLLFLIAGDSYRKTE